MWYLWIIQVDHSAKEIKTTAQCNKIVYLGELIIDMSTSLFSLFTFQPLHLTTVDLTWVWNVTVFFFKCAKPWLLPCWNFSTLFGAYWFVRGKWQHRTESLLIHGCMKTFALCGEVLTPKQASPEQNFDHHVKFLTLLFQHQCICVDPANSWQEQHALLASYMNSNCVPQRNKKELHSSFTSTLVHLLQGISKISVPTKVVNNG